MLPMDATDLLPQKYPFKMIDNLVFAGVGNYHSNFTIRQDNIMVDGNEFTEGGLIENMAQTAAAGSGFVSTQQGLPVPVGYIGAVKNVLIHARPTVDQQLETRLSLKHNVGQASIMQGEIFCEGAVIASGELTIFVAPTS
jgi:predicted hotdog family 3-hydroxylacyl-ACP dehydratase